MDGAIETADGWKNFRGICGAEPGPLVNDNQRYPMPRPCVLLEGHVGPHESLVKRSVFDTLVWERPHVWIRAAANGVPLRITED